MLLRLAYLGITNVFALLRLLPGNDRDKDAETLAFTPPARGTAAPARQAASPVRTSLGVKVAASTIWQIPREAGINPAPDRAATTWTAFLRSQAEALLAADFIDYADRWIMPRVVVEVLVSRS